MIRQYNEGISIPGRGTLPEWAHLPDVSMVCRLATREDYRDMGDSGIGNDEREQKLRVALLQMAARGMDQAANLQEGELYCRRAKGMGADIALFPEMWNIGYTSYSPGVWRTGHDTTQPDADELRLRAEWQATAVGPEDDFVMHFRELARELEMAIAITYLERWPGAPRNTVSLIDRHGEIVLTYAKVHTCDFSMERACTPGDGFRVAELDTGNGPVQVGAMICFDREAPESARILMLQGAEIILVPNACTLEQHRLRQIRTRAYENEVGIAMTNYAAPDQNGHSIAVDAVAFDAEGPRDTVLVEAGEVPGIHLADFDLGAIRAYRAREIWGNAYRKPKAYTALVDRTVVAPFVRDGDRR